MSDDTWKATINTASELIWSKQPISMERLGHLQRALELGPTTEGIMFYERAIDGLDWPAESAPPRTDERGKKLFDAYSAGEDKGKAAAAWLLDGNSSTADACFLLQRVLDAELDVPAPLSCEWADGLTIGDVLGSLDIPLEHEDADSVLQAWEDGYSAGYYDEAERSAREMADIPVL